MSDSAVAVAAPVEERGRIGQPDRALDRCYELGQLSLKCQTKYMIEWNHRQAGQAIKHACRSDYTPQQPTTPRPRDRASDTAVVHCVRGHDDALFAPLTYACVAMIARSPVQARDR